MSKSEKEKVLIADCEPNFVASTKKALEDHYEVSVVGSRREALETAKTTSPHIVIVGFLEPRGDSFRLHRELRGEPITSYIPLLVVDVCLEEHCRKGWRPYEGMQMDAENYFTRPVESVELKEEVARIIQSAAPQRLESRVALEQIDKVLKRVERIEKALGPELLQVRGSGSVAGLGRRQAMGQNAGTAELQSAQSAL